MEKMKYLVAIKEELDFLKQKGVVIKLEGIETSALEIAQACMIEEEGSYMRDYVWDDSNALQEVDFYRIKE